MCKGCKNTAFISITMLSGLLMVTFYIDVIWTNDLAWGAQFSNQSKSFSSSNSMQGQCTCTNNVNGFAITPPSHWTNWNNCTFFTPPKNLTYPDLSQTDSFVRISRTNLSGPISSLQELYDNVKWFTDRSFYKPGSTTFPVQLPVGNALRVVYFWNQTVNSFGPPITVLPFVNDSNTFSNTPTESSSNSLYAAPRLSPFATVPSPGKSLNATASTSPQSITVPPAGTTIMPVQVPPPGVFVSPPKPSQARPSQATTPVIPETIMAIYIVNKDKVYVIEYNAQTNSFPNYLQAITQMIYSFRFVPPNSHHTNSIPCS